MQPTDGHFKDAILNDLATQWNVAQFVSFDPELNQRFAWIHGYSPNVEFASPLAAIQALLAKAPEGSVNIRSFEPGNPKSREFIYGQTNPSQILAHVERLARSRLFTIVNETVDVNDGGVSGVALGNAIEFAPGDTPRAVEKAGTAALPRRLGLKLLNTVYHFSPKLPTERRLRTEFSVHPLRRGYRHEHTIIWETERVGQAPTAVEITWPNLFSMMLGDKVYGLLIAHLSGLRIPRSVVIPRHVAPFEFGTPTGSSERWIRTSPRQQVPGRFTTKRGWTDPFKLLLSEDPSAIIASVLSQDAVEAEYSGAAISQADGSILVEGVQGQGDEFMVGHRAPEALPPEVVSSVLAVYERGTKQLGPARLEWVFDGKRVWVVQFHRGASPSSGRIVFPGEPAEYLSFPVERGLEELRALVAQAHATGQGIILVGRVGITSHFGDVLRRARIPSHIEEPAQEPQAV